jgi:aminoglycoside 3-N-acetyltransferase
MGRGAAGNVGTSPGPVTPARLVRDLRKLGVTKGQTLLAHVSLRSIGWVDGGAEAVVAALRQAVGASGNVVMLTATQENSRSSRAHQAKIAGLAPGVVEKYLQTMPAFDVDHTPCDTGAVAEALRTARSAGAVRSEHPQSSFAAIGPDAAQLMAGHLLECHHGEDSPLAKLYARDARVLMIGVGYRACTAIHLAEYRYTQDPPVRDYTCVIAVGGEPCWITYKDVELDDSCFDVIGAYIEARTKPRLGRVGGASSRMLPMREIVDNATEWMKVNRRPLLLSR